MAYEKKTYPKKGTKKSWNKGTTESVEPEVRKFENPLKQLMTEAEKADAQVLELSYDFSSRIIRLYKYLNEAQHPQSDADFLSKASIALKEARESENWLSLLRDNGYLSTVQAESLLTDCKRINKILITITAKVRKRLNS